MQEAENPRIEKLYEQKSIELCIGEI